MNQALENLEDEFYDLIGRIESGDVTDLDTAWTSIIGALKKLPFRCHVEFGGIKDIGLAMEILCKECEIEADDVVSILSQLQDLLDQKSHDSISEEDLDEAQSLVAEFEGVFLAFLHEKLAPILEEDEEDE